MTTQTLSFLVIAYFIVSCNNQHDHPQSVQSTQISLVVDTLVSYYPKHNGGYYINISIRNNNSFPIFLQTIDSDTSINYLDSFYFSADSAKLVSFFDPKMSLDELNSINLGQIKIDANSSIAGKFLWLHDDDLRYFKKKLIYKATYQFYKACVDTFPTSLNTQIPVLKDELECRNFYRMSFYVLVDFIDDAYHIYPLKITNDSDLILMRNRYLH